MFLLVLVRMSGLLDEVESQHDQLQTAFSDLEQAQSERKLLLDRTVHAAEEERIRLAANLHDGPIQRLASVSLTLDRAMLRLDRGDPVVAGDLLERGQDELQAEVDALRRMMTELRPPILDEAGFEAGVRDLVDDFAERTNVGGRVSGALLAPLPPDTETALYRVVQEALWNVAKHADATAVEVELRDLGGVVELTVADDGQGFRPHRPRHCCVTGTTGWWACGSESSRPEDCWWSSRYPGAGTRLTARVPRTADLGREALHPGGGSMIATLQERPAAHLQVARCARWRCPGRWAGAPATSRLPLPAPSAERRSAGTARLVLVDDDLRCASPCTNCWWTRGTTWWARPGTAQRASP